MGFLKLFRIDVFLYGSLQGLTSKFSEKPTALLSKWEKTKMNVKFKLILQCAVSQSLCNQSIIK